MMESQAIWQVQRCEGSEYLCSILEFLLPEYIRIFGQDVMTAATCIVYNDSSSECPRFNHTTPLTIRLSQASLSFWAQTIYQLSHELCHYAMYQTKQDKTQTLSWFEEIVSEAMSLYALHYAADNWKKCKLSNISPEFGVRIQDYLDGVLRSASSDGFKRCDTIEKLKNYESCKRPENDRATHVEERNIMYEAIMREPNEASCFLQYQRYIQPENGVALDFATWYRDEPKSLILQLCSIFPIKGEEEKCNARTNHLHHLQGLEPVQSPAG